MAASSRQMTGKLVKRLRAQGQLPAVVYGHRHPGQPVALDLKEFQRVYQHAGRTRLVELTLDGKEYAQVLIRELQYHPRHVAPLHVDLYRVDLKQKLQAEVPINLVGEADPVRHHEAEILVGLHALKVECLPANLPQYLDVDVSSLRHVDDTIRVQDLSLPEGVSSLVDGDELIVKLASPRVATAVEAAEEAAEGQMGVAETATASQQTQTEAQA